LGPNTLLNTLFSNTLSLRSSLNVSDQVSHPYKTTGKLYTIQLTYINLLFTYIHLWNFQTLFFQVALQTLCWLEHAGRTDRHVTNTELKLGNAKTLPMLEHSDLKTYGECTLNYRHSPSRYEMKGTNSLTGSLYPWGKGHGIFFTGGWMGLKAALDRAGLRKKVFPYQESNFVFYLVVSHYIIPISSGKMFNRTTRGGMKISGVSYSRNFLRGRRWWVPISPRDEGYNFTHWVSLPQEKVHGIFFTGGRVGLKAALDRVGLRNKVFP